MECFVPPPFAAPRRARMASGASKTTPGRPKDGLQALQDAPKAPPRRFQDGPRHPQDGTNCAQLLLRPPRSPRSLDFGPFGTRFWTLQSWIFDPLYVVFRSSRPRNRQIENRKIDNLQLCYFSYWRGGGDAALLRIRYPPRQALCLRMAYRVPYPYKILILISFLISFLMFLIRFLIMSGKS